MRKFAAALVLGLIMCLALFTTGAFAQSAYLGHGVSATAIAVAGGNHGWNGGSGFGWGCGGWNNGLFPGFFGGNGTTIAVADAGWGW